MFKLQQKVGIVITALAAWTAIGNAMNYHNFFDLLSIILALISVAIFTTSIFVDRNWMRVAQVICISVVGIFSITSEPEKIVDVICGCCFLIFSFVLTFTYELIDRYPVVIVTVLIFSVIFSFSVYTGSTVTGAGIGFALTAFCVLLWAVAYTRLKPLIQIIKKMVKVGDKMDGALMERKDHGEIKR